MSINKKWHLVHPMISVLIKLKGTIKSFLYEPNSNASRNTIAVI